MRVWIVNPFDSLPPEGSRPQRYWLMARAFAAAGHAVRLWSSDFNHATKAKRAMRPLPGKTDGSDAAGDGFRVDLLPTRPYPTNVCFARIRSHRALAKEFERRSGERIAAGENPDLIVASTPPLGLCAAALRVARGVGATFVCDIQDAWPETFLRLFPVGFKSLGRLLLAPLERRAREIYRQADLVTGVCRRYAKLSGRSDFHLAYHGISAGTADASSVSRPSPSASSQSAVSAFTRLAYVGNLGVGYDLETVLRAMATRADLTLEIAGRGPKEARLRRLAAELRLDGRVTFHGFLGETALDGMLARCEVGVIPMRDDSWVGLPYKLGDYLKAGLHVVSSLQGECGEWLARTDAGRTYAWGSSDSFLAALDSLPHAAVNLPDELRSDRIYPLYVNRILKENENET